MSGTLRRSCFWMTIIKSNPGDEFYCEAPDTDECYFNCDNCEWFITQSDMQCMSLHIINLFREFLPKKSDTTKHGRWIRKESKRSYWFECSECGYPPPLNKFKREWFSNYCPNCGAIMDEVEE